jgi:hypothetical protein
MLQAGVLPFRAGGLTMADDPYPTLLDKARKRLPAWFWRREKSLAVALVDRTRWMFLAGFVDDHAFDLLLEYAHAAGVSLSEDEAVGAIRFVFWKPAGGGRGRA